ncbi:MAG: hypothetical protein NW217_07635 [Hyphomicrobiaceae bacterium]|nr:hypothetical protein [Hyphomicrobiaceae bacterium]
METKPETDFEPGQVWRVKGRLQDGDVHAAVLAVLHYEGLGFVCSVALTEVRIMNPHVAGGIQTMVPHIPITAEMFEDAVMGLAGTGGPTAADADFAAAYEQWRTPFEKGEAGVFTVPLADVIELLETAISEPKGRA